MGLINHNIKNFIQTSNDFKWTLKVYKDAKCSWNLFPPNVQITHFDEITHKVIDIDTSDGWHLEKRNWDVLHGVAFAICPFWQHLSLSRTVCELVIDVITPPSVAKLVTLIVQIFWLSQIRHSCKQTATELKRAQTALKQRTAWLGTLRTSGWLLQNPAPSLSFFSAQIPGKPCQDVAQY